MNQRSFPGPSVRIIPACADSNKRAREARRRLEGRDPVGAGRRRAGRVPEVRLRARRQARARRRRLPALAAPRLREAVLGVDLARARALRLPAATWASYVEGTAAGESPARLAARCGACAKTSWFMRMRALEAMRSQLQPMRGGDGASAQADELYLNESFSGRRSGMPGGRTPAGTGCAPAAYRR